MSHLGKGRYLDMLGRNLVIKLRNNRKTQQFYFDYRTRTIKSVQNKGWSFDIKNAGRTNEMQMWNTNSGWFQLFQYQGYYIKNVKNNKVV